jgi:hypothetical protein
MALAVLWGTPTLALNRLLGTITVALVAGVFVSHYRWVGLAIVAAFAGSVAVWLAASSLPVYVVAASISRLAGLAVAAALVGRLVALVAL